MFIRALHRAQKVQRDLTGVLANISEPVLNLIFFNKLAVHYNSEFRATKQIVC